MLIDGPFTVKLIENTGNLGREIHINFVKDFCSLDVKKQAKVFADYITLLHQQLKTLAQDSQEFQGMMYIAQFSESIYPHIVGEELPLEETLIIEMEPENPLTTLINQDWH